jgi:hypothetical protein
MLSDAEHSWRFTVKRAECCGDVHCALRASWNRPNLGLFSRHCGEPNWCVVLRHNIPVVEGSPIRVSLATQLHIATQEETQVRKCEAQSAAGDTYRKPACWMKCRRNAKRANRDALSPVEMKEPPKIIVWRPSKQGEEKSSYLCTRVAPHQRLDNGSTDNPVHRPVITACEATRGILGY